jgi:hypothetical protein
MAVCGILTAALKSPSNPNMKYSDLTPQQQAIANTNMNLRNQRAASVNASRKASAAAGHNVGISPLLQEDIEPHQCEFDENLRAKLLPEHRKTLHYV